jgi:hypothetical protein
MADVSDPDLFVMQACSIEGFPVHTLLRRLHPSPRIQVHILVNPTVSILTSTSIAPITPTSIASVVQCLLAASLLARTALSLLDNYKMTSPGETQH